MFNFGKACVSPRTIEWSVVHVTIHISSASLIDCQTTSHVFAWKAIKTLRTSLADLIAGRKMAQSFRRQLYGIIHSNWPRVGFTNLSCV